MKLLLISPKKVDTNNTNLRKFSFRVPPIGLAIVASLTPPDVDVSIVDENIEEVRFNSSPDLVGITTMTATSLRAYQIADKFREMGVPVVMGGIHASSLPFEAIQHADSVIIGEAEDTWGKVLRDFKTNSLKPFYYSRHPELKKLPFPRRDLFQRRKYIFPYLVETARGCPFDCNFCCVSKVFGRKFRFKPVEEVVEEIKRLKTKFVGFVDDNIVGNLRQAKKLFSALIPLKIKWVGQASVLIGEDNGILQLAKKSGCTHLFIGFETLVRRNIKEIGKRVNIIERFKDVIKRIHDAGIGIEGGFIFGLENDDKTIFEKTLEFVTRTKLDLVQFSILTPFPGTQIYYQLEREGRIFDKNWSHYDGAHVVFKPKLMKVEELQEGLRWVYREFYSLKSITNRVLHLNNRIRYFFSILGMNLAFHRTLIRRRVR